MVFFSGASVILLLMALDDAARRPQLVDAAVMPMGSLVMFLYFHSSLRDALRYGPPGTWAIPVSEYRRKSARVFAASGALLCVGAAVLWGHYALHGHTLSTSEKLFLVLLGAFALMLVISRAIASKAESRFPVVHGLALTNDTVAVLEAVLGIGGTAALVILGARQNQYSILVNVAVSMVVVVRVWMVGALLCGFAAKVLIQA